jgi:hypothetical protein
MDLEIEAGCAAGGINGSFRDVINKELCHALQKFIRCNPSSDAVIADWRCASMG